MLFFAPLRNVTFGSVEARGARGAHCDSGQFSAQNYKKNARLEYFRVFNHLFLLFFKFCEQLNRILRNFCVTLRVNCALEKT